MKNVPDTKKALADLVNIPPLGNPGSETRAKQFILKYGKLRRPLVTKPEEMDYVLDVLTVASEFRRAWKAEQSEGETQHVGSYLDSIFEPNSWATWEGSAIRADFVTGKWEPVPRNFLDVLAIQLMRSRNMLQRCENPNCQKYIVKEYSHDKYCSNRCSEIGRKEKVKLWRKNRKPATEKGRAR